MNRGALRIGGLRGRLCIALAGAVLIAATTHAQTCGGGNPCGGGDNASQSSGGPATGAGNPIDVMTGNKYQLEVDFALPGELSLRFARHYNSVSAQGGAFGGGWSHSHETSLTRTRAKGQVTIQIVQADGRRLTFAPTAAAQSGKQRYVSVPFGYGVIEEDVAGVERLRTAAEQGDTSATRLLRPWVWKWHSGREVLFDARGIVKQIRDPDGEALQLVHDQRGRLTSILDARGRRLTVSYWDDAAERLSRFEQSDGSQQAQGERFRVKSVTLPDGRTLQYSYDSNGLLAQVVYPDGTVKRYEYVLAGGGLRLSRIVGRDGKTLGSYDYDGEGRAIASTRGEGGERLRVDYRSPARNGELGESWVTGPSGQRTLYRWRMTDDAQTQLIDSSGPGCASCPDANVRYHYDSRSGAEGLITRVERLELVGEGRFGPYISADDIERDTLGRITARYRDDEGERALLERYEYSSADPLAKPTRIERPSVVPGFLHTFDIRYNERGQPLSVSESGFAPRDTREAAYAISRTTTYAYYDGGKLKSIDGPLPGAADLVTYKYGAKGELLTIVYPEQGKESFAYDAAGRLTSHVPLDGIALALAYDAEHRVRSVTRAGLTVEIGYDLAGRMERMRDPLGQTYTFGYDAAARVNSIKDSGDNRIVLDFDREGRPTVRRLLNPDGSVSQELDASPEDVVRAEPKQSWNPSVLALIRLPMLTPGKRAEPLIADVSVPAQPEQQVWDARALASTYRYDDFGRLSWMQNPDSGVVAFSYDAAGRLVERVLADGNSTRYDYDARGRPTRIETSDETTVIEYGAFGKPARIVYGAGEELFEYDWAARIVQRTHAIDGLRFVTSFDYDELGRLSQSRLAGGETLVYRYNPTIHAKPGLLSAIERRDILGATTIISGINDAEDRFDLQTARFGNGLTFERQLDRRGRLLRYGTPGVAAFDFSGRADGRIGGVSGATRAAFDYDHLGRVANVTQYGPRTSTALSLSFDAADNLLAIDRARRETSYRVDELSNRLLSRRTADGRTQTYAYDAAGRTRSIGDRRFEYDGTGRLAKVFDGTRLTAEYAYNAFGERIRKVVYSGSRRTVSYYFYDGSKLAAEADESGEVLRRYVYLLDRPVALLAGREVYALHTDWRGGTVAATDEDGRIAWRADNDVFGRTRVQLANVTLNLRGSNQFFDAETGLHYNLNRYFDPDAARYLTPDPIGQDGGLNLYAFVAGDPVNAIDPLGTQSTPLPNNTDVTGWSFQDRLAYVLRQAIPLVPGEIGAQLQEMISPANIAVVAGVFAVWAAAHLTPAGWIADAALGVLGYIFMGEAVIRLMELTIETYQLTSSARCVADLNRAARNFASIASEVAIALGGAGATRIARLMGRFFRNTRSGAWNLNPFERGRAIERALGANTPTNNYPVIDRWNPATRVGTSIKSVDLNAATYQRPSALRSLLQGYVDDLANFNGANHGGLNTTNLIRGRTLEVAIPNAPSAAQRQVINQMIQYAQSRGVTLRIIVFP